MVEVIAKNEIKKEVANLATSQMIILYFLIFGSSVC